MTDIVRVDDEYYVRASSALADDRTRVLKYGDTFAVFNRYGDIEPLGLSQFGLFCAETRHLSRLTLRLDRRQPMLLSSKIRDDDAFIAVDLTNVDTPAAAESFLARGTIHAFRLVFLRDSSCYQRVRFTNYGATDVRVSASVQFDADFADIFEVRGTKRARKGERLPDELEGAGVTLAYEGLDRVLRHTRLEFSPQPSSLATGEATFEITLKPKQEKCIYISVVCERNSAHKLLAPFDSAFHEIRRNDHSAGLGKCRISTSSESFNAWITRSSADLRMLTEGNPEGPYPYAGVPWFNTVFGRDGIITALECLWIAPRIAESVLRYLAEAQATEEIPEQDAEPGKILHEMRRGEMATMKEVPFARYYGSVDSTPLFVMLAGAYFERTSNLAFLKEIWPNIKRCITWIDKYGDRDGDGFVEYQQQSTKGLVQQGWKDSYDSVFHADGRLAAPPIALCEVQAYVYAAKRAASLIARALDETEFANNLDIDAKEIQANFERDFWCTELGTYAMALDGQKQKCCVRTSNAGHALFARITSQNRAECIARLLLSEQCCSGWGIRTVGAFESRYNPMSYHNGSVWPHDNALIGLGFSFYGMHEQACQLLQGLYEASRYVESHRMPELFCGFHKRPEESGPTSYPVACAPQAWAAGSVFLLLSAALGLEVRATDPQITFTSPCLPESVDWIEIQDLQISKDVAIDAQIRRFGSIVKAEVYAKCGTLEIVTNP